MEFPAEAGTLLKYRKSKLQTEQRRTKARDFEHPLVSAAWLWARLARGRVNNLLELILPCWCGLYLSTIGLDRVSPTFE